MTDGLRSAQRRLLAQDPATLSYLLSAGQCLDLIATNCSGHMKVARVHAVHDDVIQALSRLVARPLHLSPARFTLGNSDFDS